MARTIGSGLTTPISKELGFSFDRVLWSYLGSLRSAVLNQDFDTAIIVDGGEGGGKSVLGMQIAHALDIDRTIDIDTQVCYYPEQFQKAVMGLKKGKAIVWDEARRGLSRRRTGEKTNIDVLDMLAECRQHNLFMVIIMPSFYDMEMNVAVWRTRLLVHVFYTWDLKNKDKPLKRGFFRFYSEDGKKALYTNKFLRQAYAYPNMFKRGMSSDGRFPHHYVVDEQKYRNAKREAEKIYRAKDNTSACPECGSRTRYNRTENKFYCRECPWTGEVVKARPTQGVS